MKYFPAFLFFTSLLLGQTGDDSLGGYANRTSYFPGDTVHFFVSVDRAIFNLRILRNGNTVELKTVLSELTGGIQTSRDSSYWYGCTWLERGSLIIPQDWQSGVYFGEFLTAGGTPKRIIFIVKNPALTNDILFVISTNTYQLYNNFGGKSGYDFNSSNNKRSYKLSYARPYRGRGDGIFSDVPYQHDPNYYVPQTGWEPRMITWAEQNGYQMDYCTDTDLETTPNMVNNYKIVLMVGHSEYWSNAMRSQLSNYVHSGGRMVILSGNTGWVQVRFEDNCQTIVCYKDKNLDPMYHVVDSLVTVAFAYPPINKPSQHVIGTSWDQGGVVNYIFKNTRILTTDSGYGGYAVFNPENWVYRGTGLKLLDHFGTENGIVGYETDGFDYRPNSINWQFGFPTGFIGPEKFEILGYHPAKEWDNTRRGNAIMGYFYTKEGGAVFNASTTNWAHGLPTNPIVQRITKNVLDRFLSGNFPPEINWIEPKRSRPAVVYGDTVLVRKEVMRTFPGDSVAFFMNARDYFNKPIACYWTLNGSRVSTHATFIFKPNGYQNGQLLQIRAFVYNATDTVSAPITLIYKDLDIITSSDTLAYVGKTYAYPVNAVSYIGSALSVRPIQTPRWMHYDSTSRKFVGTAKVEVAGDSKKQKLIFSVSDSLGNADTSEVWINVLQDSVSQEASAGSYPKHFQMTQNYPNPFNGSTRIDYYLSKPGQVKFSVYNIIGQKVASLFSGSLGAGNHYITWDPGSLKRGVSSGSYLFYGVVVFGDGTKSEKIIRVSYIK